ncbi:benzoate/H(+) symporter BenE family transporter [Nocardioides sp. MAH-18]|uniref:Benzoate/H(+) symporter BenE family transporter n=1 Tax=Nocardioides agri TaxID=2682843 RepID=A0A6L6XQ52_9ACTN|nr:MULTISPECIES: benzoate/H(+) symporter BenE family transporter [unclassified Nocardioides]MBA2953945.1 benzoate/H(+) symporter BenE family transporter [Nocardioides sp. CGMCC 1.13656]MVQ48807.1 benzoate/H(+) symporter BenE family transporter [Nocardioides sp. MAH-18]
MTDHHGTPVVTGIVTAVVGFSSSFVVVLAGLAAVGATPDQAASGILALCVTLALGMLWLALRHRSPFALAWSTPGAALLLSTGAATGGWAAAVGAFVVAGVLILLTGLVPALGDLIARIPTSLARAMLAGVLVPICLEPVIGLADSPAYVGPVVLAWLVMHRVSRRWAVPVSLAVAVVVVLVTAGSSVDTADLVPSLTWTTPHWTLPAVVSIGIPLYIVTMASQNVPGVAVTASYGYTVPWREAMTVTGLGTLVGAPFGGHAINLAAITAAMTAGPMAGPDRARRWVASASAAVCYLVLALGCAALAALVAAAPGGVMQAAAGLALLGTLGSSLAGALADEHEREAAAVCFLVAASGITVLGVGAAFWALVAGLVLRPLLGASRRVSSPR